MTLCSECKENANTLSSSQGYPIALVVVSIAVKQNAPKQHMFAVTQFLWGSSSGVAFWVSHLGCQKGSVNVWPGLGSHQRFNKGGIHFQAPSGCWQKLFPCRSGPQGRRLLLAVIWRPSSAPAQCPQCLSVGTSPNRTTHFIDLARKRKPPSKTNVHIIAHALLPLSCSAWLKARPSTQGRGPHRV